MCVFVVKFYFSWHLIRRFWCSFSQKFIVKGDGRKHIINNFGGANSWNQIWFGNSKGNCKWIYVFFFFAGKVLHNLLCYLYLLFLKTLMFCNHSSKLP